MKLKELISIGLITCTKAYVYVRIPQYGTKRAAALGEYNIYENKVRKANLYIQKLDLEYILLTKYSVLDGQANIVAWIDTRNIMDLVEAIDDVLPTPIRIN